MEARIEELARIIAEETDNALRPQARPEAALTADIFRYFGGLAGELKGETIPLGEHVLSYIRHEPLGVVGAIIPAAQSLRGTSESPVGDARPRSRRFSLPNRVSYSRP
jgi:acyl-CoA reductase-like NAD-dependent aldehyde dehydrogenase